MSSQRARTLFFGVSLCQAAGALAGPVSCLDCGHSSGVTWLSRGVPSPGSGVLPLFCDVGALLESRDTPGRRGWCSCWHACW